MNYRIAIKDDLPKIQAYCLKYGIKPPMEGLIYIALTDDGSEIKGIAGLKQVTVFEPLIAESGVVANNLFRMMEGVILKETIPYVWGIKPTDKNIKLYEKAGYKVIEKNINIVEKNYNGTVS